MHLFCNESEIVPRRNQTPDVATQSRQDSQRSSCAPAVITLLGSSGQTNDSNLFSFHVFFTVSTSALTMSVKVHSGWTRLALVSLGNWQSVAQLR